MLAIKPFDKGEDDVIEWCMTSGFVHATQVVLLECGYDLILCKRMQHYTKETPAQP